VTLVEGGINPPLQVELEQGSIALQFIWRGFGDHYITLDKGVMKGIAKHLWFVSQE
jgi:hypothetical protein